MHKQRMIICRLAALLVAGINVLLAQNARDFTNFSYKDWFGENPTTVSATAAMTANSCETSVNGNDSRRPARPFTFEWGDGTTTKSFFPATHVYGRCDRNYIIEVKPDYGDGPQRGAIAAVLFTKPATARPSDLPANTVTAPSSVPPIGTRLYPMPTGLVALSDSDFGGLGPFDVESILSAAALIQREYVGTSLAGGTQSIPQIMLKDPNSNSGVMYSLWFLDPWVFVIGSKGGSQPPQFSSFFHEMGHNFTLNIPAGFYFGGRVDGNANAIYSETMAQIFQHAAGYELVRGAANWGLDNDYAAVVASSLMGTMSGLRASYDAYAAAGSPYTSWNDPSTSQDEASGTFMSLAYIFLREAELRALGYHLPVQRMVEFLSLWNQDWMDRYDQRTNTDLASQFRATLMVAAVSHGLQADMRDVFRGLNFPVDDTSWAQLTGANIADVSAQPSAVSIGPDGGRASLTIRAPSTVAWTAASDASWLLLEKGTAGRGRRELEFRVLPNKAMAERSAKIRVGGAEVVVTQSGLGVDETLITTRVLPQFLFGKSGAETRWSYSILFANPGSKASATLSFKRDDGSSLAPNGGPLAESFEIPAGGAVRRVYGSELPFSTGWVKAELPNRVSGYGVWRLSVDGKPDQEASVPLLQASSPEWSLAWDETDVATRVVILNPGTSDTEVATILNSIDGTTLAEFTIALGAGRRTEVLLSEHADLANKKGAAVFRASEPVVVMGLRIGKESVTTIPATPR